MPKQERSKANQQQETSERLIRVRATRRGTPIELRVHYEVATVDGCSVCRVFAVEEVE